MAETVPAEELFPPFRAPDDLVAAAAAKGWPDDLVQRAVDLRLGREVIEAWLQAPPEVMAEVQEGVRAWERLRFGTLQARQATHGDGPAFSELWARSSEQIGGWDVTVERAPNPFAQFRLQDRAEVVVLADRGLVLASVVWAHADRVVGGEHLHVLCSQGLRVHEAFLRQGLGRLVRGAGRSALVDRVDAEFFYIRGLNFGMVEMLKRTNPGWWEAARAHLRADDVPGVEVSVQQYGAAGGEPSREGVRRATRADVAACAALIDRTHGHLDLYEPVSSWVLERRLDQWRRGRRMPGLPKLYGWDDFWVVEEDGVIVACGGLWDRGRDVRERWLHRETGEELVLSATNLLDFGFAPGREDALARLVEVFVADTAAAGRTHLVAPLQPFPEVGDRLAHLPCTEETRGLQWRMWDPASGREMADPAPPVVEPFTDLRYW